MPEQFPMVLYHEDGSHRVVPHAEAKRALGAGWSDKITDKHHEAIRRASGGVAEVVVPVTRTRVEAI